LILQDGSVKYQRIRKGTTTKITGPIKEFLGNNFLVEFAFFTTTFEVSRPPHAVDGTWLMTVDGVTLKKKQQPDKYKK